LNNLGRVFGFGIDNGQQWAVANHEHAWFTSSDGNTYVEQMRIGDDGRVGLLNPTANTVDFGKVGVGPPNPAGGPGWKIKTWNDPSTLTSGFGVDNNGVQWAIAPNQHAWYWSSGGGYGPIMTLDSAGTMSFTPSRSVLSFFTSFEQAPGATSQGW